MHQYHCLRFVYIFYNFVKCFDILQLAISSALQNQINVDYRVYFHFFLKQKELYFKDIVATWKLLLLLASCNSLVQLIFFNEISEHVNIWCELNGINRKKYIYIQILRDCYRNYSSKSHIDKQVNSYLIVSITIIFRRYLWNIWH